MLPLKADIIARLQKDILPLQGFRSKAQSAGIDLGLGPVCSAFPNHTFPLGAIHEFICKDPEGRAASSGFITGLLSSFMQEKGVCLWVSTHRTLFPPALRYFGIEPHNIIFVDLRDERQLPWVMEEALKCNGLSAVVGELPAINFTTSRRLQLIVEESQVTGFILRPSNRQPGTTACLTRWQISSLPGITENEMPGVGFPKWKVELLKVRNGKPGTWELSWQSGKFKPVLPGENRQDITIAKTG